MMVGQKLMAGQGIVMAGQMLTHAHPRLSLWCACALVCVHFHVCLSVCVSG